MNNLAEKLKITFKLKLSKNGPLFEIKLAFFYLLFYLMLVVLVLSLNFFDSASNEKVSTF